MDFVTVPNGPVDLNLAVAGRGPLILCVHGFPELWYSWRHQMAHFSELGYTVAALDVRGYGRSTAKYSAAIDTQFAVAQIVHEHKDNVGLLRLLRCCRCDRNDCGNSGWYQQTEQNSGSTHFLSPHKLSKMIPDQQRADRYC